MYHLLQMACSQDISEAAAAILCGDGWLRFRLSYSGHPLRVYVAAYGMNITLATTEGQVPSA